MRSAHCPLRPGHCPLRQRIVRMPITPPQCGLSPERNAPPCCLLRAPHCRSQLCALSAALSSALSALRSQRCSQLQPLAPAPSDDDDLRTSCGPGLPPGAQPLPEDIFIRTLRLRPRRLCVPRLRPRRCGLAAVSIAFSAALPLRPRRSLCLTVRPRPRSQR